MEKIKRHHVSPSNKALLETRVFRDNVSRLQMSCDTQRHTACMNYSNVKIVSTVLGTARSRS